MPNVLAHIKGVLLILLGLFMPISVFATDFLIAGLALCWLLEGNFALKWEQIKKRKWVLSLLALMALYLTGMLWGQYHGGAVWVFQKISILLLLPILLTLDLSQKQLKMGLKAFFASVFLSALLALLINAKMIPYLFRVFPFITKNWDLSAFMPYNYHNVYLAISVLLLAYKLLKMDLKNFRKTLGLLLAIVVMLLSLFTENGRAGQLAFLVLTFLLIVYLLGNQKRSLLLALLFFGIGVNMAYDYSPVFKKRLNRTVQEYENRELKPNSSIAVRISLWGNSWSLIKNKPLLGHGTGSFVEVFSQISEDTAQLLSGKHKTPHNNYLFVWFELGILGLILFVSIFFFQLKEYASLPHALGRCLLPLMFLMIMFSDSYFHNHNSAVLYAFLSAILARYSL